ncbi:hypothetical protein DB30_01377 [Enhygromyxa salina]|uniref:Uncharacterized protein n=1 Tax=Enhygromyxa salina TaxID=215803 RepID=A0A0C2A4H2_9BACT|nr:hypothetical protein [Enhygromyxa salina]KIG18268.1 hypothetical protein DB30_01377 [Enhygromyxa salina]
MHTENDDHPEPKDVDGAPAAWVGAAGVSGDHVIENERAPRLHRTLMVLGPLGVALAIVLSLWSMSRKLEHSVNIQVETKWAAGEQLAVRTQIVNADLAPLAGNSGVYAQFEDADGITHELGALELVGPGLSQGVISVPAQAPGAGQLVLRYSIDSGESFEERVPVEIVAQRGAGAGRQVVSENMLQWADDTDPQPEGVRVDLRPDGRLLAGFDNRLFVRVTDPSGLPWAPKGAAAKIQVLLVSGEFGDAVGTLDRPPVLYEGPLDALGLASFHGVLSSDVVRFEVRLIGETEIAQAKADQAAAAAQAAAEAAAASSDGQPPTTNDDPSAAPPAPAQVPAELLPGEGPPSADTRYLSGPKRRLRFVSHAGTVRITATTDFAHPGDTIGIAVEALSARKDVFVDVHGPGGAWLDTMTPPLHVPQERDWTVPEQLAGAATDAPFIQFEAYQSMLRPEDSSAIARVQIAPQGAQRSASLMPLIKRQREQLSLPRVDREFEIGRERAYLTHVETQLSAKALSADTITLARAFLIGSLEAVVHGPPQSLNTRGREEQTLATFKRNWTVGIRWFLLGGGALFIVVMSTLVWRNQRQLEAQTSVALGLVAGGPSPLDEEMYEDQSRAILQARRQMLARGVLTVVFMVATLLLTVAMLESLVWEY